MQYLDKMGFKHSLLGFKYAVVIIMHCLDNPQDVYQICNTYEVCAQKVGVSATQFERALRHEVRMHAKSGLTNKEFVAQAVDHIGIELASENAAGASDRERGQ
jgi:hypothetical protein